jgi:hypothetical protein
MMEINDFRTLCSTPERRQHTNLAELRDTFVAIQRHTKDVNAQFSHPGSLLALLLYSIMLLEATTIVQLKIGGFLHDREAISWMLLSTMFFSLFIFGLCFRYAAQIPEKIDRALLELNILQEIGFNEESPQRMAAFVAHLRFASDRTGIYILSGKVTFRRQILMCYIVFFICLELAQFTFDES